MQTETIAGVSYSTPNVTLLQHTGLGTSEYAARTCYDSFDASENGFVQAINSNLPMDQKQYDACFNNQLANLEHSDLLDKLAWTHFHYSILEHANLTYLIKGTSRGVLQEHARHRIQAISVRSTRYTMSPIINAFTASITTSENFIEAKSHFIRLIHDLDFLVTTDFSYNKLEYTTIFDKLRYQWLTIGREAFLDLAVAKSSRAVLNDLLTTDKLYNSLQVGKAKRNVGDNFKHIVSDNWKVDLVVTFNLRSLKNYFSLRDSGAAFFGIRTLAQQMKAVTPQKYLDLIVK